MLSTPPLFYIVQLVNSEDRRAPGVVHVSKAYGSSSGDYERFGVFFYERLNAVAKTQK